MPTRGRFARRSGGGGDESASLLADDLDGLVGLAERRAGLGGEPLLEVVDGVVDLGLERDQAGVEGGQAGLDRVDDLGEL